MRILTLVAVFLYGAARGTAQPAPVAPSSQATLEQAIELTREFDKLYTEGKYSKALAPAEQALALREKVLRPNHPDIAESLNNLGAVYLAQGEFAKAEKHFARALHIRESALGAKHADVGVSLVNLATVYRLQGAYAKAERPYLRALDILEKALGPNDHGVGQTVNNLALCYQERGMYSKAEPLFLRGLDIFEKTLGPSSPEVARGLNNVALLYTEQGAYAKAEPLCLRALAIREKALGPGHPHVANSLNNLALIYERQGAYTKAEPLVVRAHEIHEKTFGPAHPDVASSLTNLAALYAKQGEYTKAEPLYLRALAIREKALGPGHPHVANSLNNLGVLYSDQGEYAKAEPVLIRALHIREETLTPNHPEVAISLNNLATAYLEQGQYAKAETLYTRAFEIRKKVLGPSHPDFSNSLNNLARTYWNRGGNVKAESLFARAADTREQQLRIDLVRLPELRKRALMTLLQRDTDRVISFHAHAVPDSTGALDLALTTVLRRKGRILNSLVDSETRIRRNVTPRLRELLDELSRSRSELAAHLYAPAGRRGATDRAGADRARARIDELETKLSAASAEFRTEAESITVPKVRAQLPRGTALVEFTKYRRFDPRQAKLSQLQEERYVAYLLTAGGSSQWVALGDAAPIDAQIDAMIATLRYNTTAETANAALQRLDKLVLAPIRAKLPGISHLILAPDDKLNLVPFEALVDSQGHYTLENYLVSYVTSGRDLLRFTAARGPRSPAVIIADPEYGPLPPPGPGTISFRPLPGARAEAMDLQKYFVAAPLTGDVATKAALAALIGPAILHIATHGFYTQNAATSRPGPGVLRDVARDLHLEPSPSSQASPSRSDELADALDRSGLAMAGANQGAEGIVTAREIAGFDWWGTQLVVLSACDTGVGAASAGDGVYGLRRALMLAGAASQVVSLWAIDDAATRALMQEFYGNLARGIGRAAALRQAKLYLLQQPKYGHPFYWAAFIAAGDWRPVDKTILAPPKSP